MKLHASPWRAFREWREKRRDQRATRRLLRDFVKWGKNAPPEEIIASLRESSAPETWEPKG